MKNLMKNYGKGILAVLGAFLMLTFTLPSFMKNMQDPSAGEAGRLNGRKVTFAEVTQAARELSLLRSFQLVPQALSLVREENEIDRGTHWFLLVREAAQSGMVAADAEIREAVAAANMPADELVSRLSDAGLSQQDMRGCVAHALMVWKEAILSAVGAQTPAPEIEYLANEELSTVRIKFIEIDGTDGWNKQPEPTEAQIKKQFDLYKDVVAMPPGSETIPPAIDSHTYPFGYKYPDRVKVEYLKFDHAAVASRFQPTREDFQEAYKYYAAHPAEFKSQSSTSLTVGATKSFDEVREQLVKDQVAGRVTKFLKRISDRVLETTKQPWNNAKPDEGGFRETLPQDKWVDYKALAQDLKQSKEFDGYAPEYVQIGAWQGHTDLRKLEGIGESYYETPSAHYPFADVATHVRELELPKDTFPRLFLQVGTDAPVLTDNVGNLYIFRVTAAEKSHVPASLEEVRGQVVEDLKKLAAYQQKQADAKSLADAAATGDLSTLGKKQGLQAVVVPELTRLGEDRPDVRRIPGLLNAAFDLARAPSSTQPAATQNADTHKTTTVNVESMLKVFVVALDGFKPVDANSFASNRATYLRGAKQLYGRMMLANWTRLDAVAKRLHYIPKTAFAPEKEPE